MGRWSTVSTVLCDLDGVVWLAGEPIEGAVDAIARLRTTGRRVVFVTNNSAATEAEHVAALGAIGVPADGDVVSSAMAGAHLVEPGQRVLVSAGRGVSEAVERRGATAVVNDGTVDPEGFDAVVVGIDRRIDYDRIAVAASAARAGAVLIGTNEDSTYPTPRGLLPGGGAILAAIATAAGVRPVIGGKPHDPMADLIRSRIAPERADTALMVGDRLETDGLFARAIGCRYALVRSGVTAPGREVASPTDDGVVIDLDVDDLAAVAAVLASDPRPEE